MDVLHPRRGARPAAVARSATSFARPRSGTLDCGSTSRSRHASAVRSSSPSSRMSARRDGPVAVVTGAAQGLGEAIATRLLSETATASCSLTSTSSWFERPPGQPTRAGSAQSRADLDVRRARVRRALSRRRRRTVGTRRRLGEQRCAHGGAPFPRDRPRRVGRRRRHQPARHLLRLSRRGHPHVRARAGRIINLASVAGQWGRGLTGAHYAASKAGIVAITRYGGDRVRPAGSHSQRGRAGSDRRAGGRGDACRHDRRPTSRGSRSGGSAGRRRSPHLRSSSRRPRRRSRPGRHMTSTAAS